MVKKIRVIFKSGASILVPYTFNFYKELNENIGKDVKIEHKKAAIKTKDIQAIVYETVEETAEETEEK